MHNIIKLYLLFAFILIKSISEEPEQSTTYKRVLLSEDSITQIKIQLCQSWSFIGHFQQVKKLLENKYSDIQVIPENYPLKNPRKTIYNVMIAIEVLIIALILLFDFIKPKIEKYVIPDIIEMFNENKIAKIALVYMMGQYIGGFIKNAGAFEVFLGDKLIYSTIENNGRAPSVSTIVRLIKKMR